MDTKNITGPTVVGKAMPGANWQESSRRRRGRLPRQLNQVSGREKETRSDGYMAKANGLQSR